eukprot:scaffold114878_cov19-Prasinocladus_malaysianus.AAC.1
MCHPVVPNNGSGIEYQGSVFTRLVGVMSDQLRHPAEAELSSHACPLATMVALHGVRALDAGNCCYDAGLPMSRGGILADINLNTVLCS